MSSRSSSSSSASRSRSRSRSGSPAMSSSPMRKSSKSPSRSRSGSPAAVSRASSVSSKRSSRSPSISSRGSKSRSPASRASSLSRSSSRSSSRSPSPEVAAKSKLKVKIKGKQAPTSKKEKAKQSEEDEGEEEEEEKSPRKGRKAKIAAAKSPKNKKKSGGNASEEGELSSDGSEKEFDDGLDDDYIGDEADRERLEKMTEKEREEELFKRAENRENLKKRFEIQRKLKQQQKLKGESSSTAGKKKAASSEEEEGEEPEEGETRGEDDDDEDNDFNSQINDAKERAQDRRKNLDAQKFDKKSSALNELKAKRQETERKKQEKRERREKEMKKGRSDGSSDDDDDDDNDDDRRKSSRDSKRNKRRDSSSSSAGSYKRRSSSSSSSSSSSDSGSDTERFQKSSKKVQKYVETQEDLEPIRLSRFKMEKFLPLPFFKELVTGCFVRIGIGQNREGLSVYRCTEITEVVETSKIYHVGKTKTNLGLKLKIGKDVRMYRLEFISNSHFTPSEFEKWKSLCLENDIPLPTRDSVQTKSAKIKKALHYEFSSADIDQIIEKKEKLNKNPKNYAMTKAKLMKEKEIATAEHDTAKANDIERQLQELEQRAEELDKRRTENTRISSISLINNRNRQNNILKAEQAIHEEIKRKGTEGVESNPFTRRRCNPRMVTKTGQPEMPQDFLLHMAEKQRQEKENREKKEILASLEELAPKRKKENEDGEEKGNSNKKAKVDDNTKDDIFDAHDFDIEIDVDTTFASATSNSHTTNPVNSSGIKPMSMAPKDTGPAKRSLNLSDYKKKRGLI